MLQYKAAGDKYFIPVHKTIIVYALPPRPLAMGGDQGGSCENSIQSKSTILALFSKNSWLPTE